ncbi:uncharacterized protein LOC131023255 [Salvia miltiorrhiza]|uniref:uncharacterized protein LOC131023255 n=1 Tax=Salvia miltiorrhiza TaxID=226208 RepID=UPI0025AB6338|nr:uncharacterized protein LOC131023255 [Salvia miltiorrhiza]
MVEKHEGSVDKAQVALNSWGGENLTAEAYNCFRDKGEALFWHKAIWRNYIPPRCSITLWLALQNRLKTVDRLQGVPKLYAICNTCDESLEHLYFKCVETSKTWREIKKWLRLKELMSTIPSAIKHLSKKNKGSKIYNKAKLLSLVVMVNHLWFARNKLIFEKEPREECGV